MLNSTLAKILIPRSKMGRIKINQEDQMCIEFAQHLRVHTLDGRLPFTWFHIPNQFGFSRPIFGVKQGWMGRIPGAADFCFVGKDNSFFIEFKAPKGRQSEEQKIFEDWCKENKVHYFIVRSAEEGLNVVNKMKDSL